MKLGARLSDSSTAPAWVKRLRPPRRALVQLRIRSSRTETLRREIREARRLLARWPVCSYRHAHWQLALAAGCEFPFKLGQGDLDGAVCRIGGAPACASVSARTDESELARALSLQPTRGAGSDLSDGC